MTGSRDRLDSDQVLDVIGSARLLPVVRTGSWQAAIDVADRLCEAGVPAIELTATTTGWTEAVAALHDRFPTVVVGVGTVVTAGQARDAIAAGAHFLVSPYPAPGVRPVAANAGVPFIEGGFTPTEVADATSRGVAKLFPAHVGGPTLLRSLLAVLPGARIIPTGGISLGDVPEWLAAGAFAVGVGSDLAAPGDVAQRINDALSVAR